MLNSHQLMLKNRKHRKPKNLYPPGPDSAVIALMVKYKSDISKTRSIHFYLYFSKTNALKAKSELLLYAFSVDIEKSAADSRWLCLATINMRPSVSELSRLRRFLEKVANDFNGFFDGWETEMLF